MESSHTKRFRRPLSLLMIDLDHFKRVNDTYGHEVGDHALSHVAAAVVATARGNDLAFRYGGEEFAVMLRDCSAEGAFAVGERLRAHLRANPLVAGGREHAITFSAGIASAHAGNDFDTSGLVARADEALYRAKRGGRDRTEIEIEKKS